MRYAAHRDKAEPAIIRALEAVGATVEQLDKRDVPDLLVGYRGQTFILEVKSPEEVRVCKDVRKDGTLQLRREAAGELTDGQAKWMARWRGKKPVVVRTPEEALRAIGALR